MATKLLHRFTAATVAASALLAGSALPAQAARPGPSFSVSSLTVAEGNSGQKQMLFNVQVKGTWNKSMKVDYQTVDGTASQGSDYVFGSGTLSFASAKRQTVSVPVNGDTEVEPDENFRVALSNPVGAAISSGGGVGTITNDDQLPNLSAESVVVGEGDAGTTPAVFKFALSSASAAPASFDYATANGSAVAPGDYESSAGTVTFDPGQVTKSVSVPVVGDTTNEGDEGFTLNLSGAAGLALPASQPTATIIDDEGVPAVSVADASVTEGDSGTVTASFDVVLSHAAATTAEVDFATTDGSAVAPGDYAANSGRLSFAPGDLFETVAIEVSGDDWHELDEDFSVTLSAPNNAVLADASGRGLINNDDSTPVLSVANSDVTEGNSGTVAATFSLSLSAPTSQAVTVAYATSDDSALAGNDYTTLAGAVTFAAGATSRTATVEVMGDTISEPAERFHFDVVSISNADLSDGTALGTIANDDRAPSKLSVKARKRPARILVGGLLTPAHGGKRVKVVLRKRSGGRWVLVRAKRPLLGSGIDRNSDGIKESAYSTKFLRPKKTKRCRVTVRFAGDADHLPSSTRTTFYC